MRVTHLINGLNVGGAENALARLTKSMKEIGIDSQVITLLPATSHHVALDVDVTTLNIASAINAIGSVRKIIQKIEAHESNILCTWLYHADLLGSITKACYKKKIPLTWNLRTSELSRERLGTSKFTRPICAKLSYYFPDVIFVNSNTVRDAHRCLGYDTKKIVKVNNGFDTKKLKFLPLQYKQFRARHKFNANQFIVGMCARWHPAKDHATFFSAAHEVLKFDPKIIFVLFGRGMTTSNTKLMKLIQKYCLNKNTLLLGQITNVEETLSALDVSVLLSNSAEGFPNAVAEAMACERYCIASDSGGAREVAGNECVIVPPNNIEAVREAIISAKNLSKERREKFGLLARQRIISNFSLTNMRDGYVHTWQSLLH